MSELSIKPLGDRVVIRPLTDDEAGSTSVAGIILPESATKEKGDQGVIVEVGPGRWNEDGDSRVAMSVKKGERVAFKSWTEKMKIGEKEYWIISESDILGIIS